MDSNADTCVFGDNSILIYDTCQTTSVEPFDASLGTIREVKIGTAAVAYDDPGTYQTYILFFHQALYIPKLKRNLICPDQLRDIGTTVNLTPLKRIPADKRTQEDHSLIIEQTSVHSKVHIPLKLRGTTSYFYTRKPTDQEIDDDTGSTCIHVHMTSDKPWDPNDTLHAAEEEALRLALQQPVHYQQRRLSLLSTTPAIIQDDRPSAALDTDYSLAKIAALFHDTPKRSVGAAATRGKSYNITAEDLAKRWRIGIETARTTLQRTTQMAIRDLLGATGYRRLKPTHYQLKYPRLRTAMYTDTMYARKKSYRGNTCAQLYCTSFHWVAVFPMKTESDAHLTLDELFRKYGVPYILVPDNAKALTQGEFKRKVQKAQANLHPIEAYMKNQNIAEDCIRELRRYYDRVMIETQTPEAFWDLCLVHCAAIRSHQALSIRELEGDVPAALITGDTPDISAIAEFGWYDYVWYQNPSALPGTERKELGRYLGLSHDVGDAMCSRIVNFRGRITSRTSVFPLTVSDHESEGVKKQKKIFEENLKRSLGKGYDALTPKEDTTPAFESYEHALEENKENIPSIVEADEIDHEAFDKYISARVCLPQGDTKSYGTVRRRKRDAEGQLIGRSNSNPIVDTAVYEVEFDNGDVENYSANLIAECVYSHIDSDGYTRHVISEIIDHRKDNTAVRADDATITRNGRTYPKRTTKGWQLCIQWNDGSTSWESLKDLKDSDPVLIAEYAVQNKIQHEPAFSWWVPFTIKQRNRIIQAAKKRYFRINQKYGIEIPKTIKRALEIDKETGTTFWTDAIRKEMKAILPAFEILPEGAPIPVGHTKIEMNMIFDVKADFTRKARYVARGDQTEPPASLTYASVVSRESVRIAFLIAALNGLDCMAADIGNAYLNAPVREKIYIICGPEFGDHNVGRKARIIKACYGLKSSGAAWRAHLAKVLHESMEFTPCRADGDVWIRQAWKPDGSRYYEYVLVYTDDILSISMDPKRILTHLDQHFLLKPSSIGPPTQYLGSSISKFTFPDGSGEHCWAMGSEQYVKEAVRNIKTWLERRGLQLKSKAPSVLPSGYKPELDTTKLCNEDDHSYFQQQIGILRWMVELGRIDIATEVSILSSYCASPRQGHLDAVCHIYAYLNTHQRSKIVFDPSYVKHIPQAKPDWTDFYKDIKEQMPHDMPEALGKEVEITCFVDSDHAGDIVTRRSRTGVLIYLNKSPIMWLSRKQNSIETSSFGSEFTALKVAAEMIEGLRYKLRMMGIPISGSAHVMADNQSVIMNSTRPESVLKKKSNSIAYHYVRERVAAGILEVSYCRTESNLADVLTKIQPGPTRKRLVEMILY